MIHFILCSIFILLLPLSAHAAYGLQDLEVLANEGSHEEFFKHAMDVRPSERLDPWKSMVSKMSEAFAQDVLSKSTVDEQHYKKSEELYKWATLRSDDVFKLRRQEIGLKYLKTCLNSQSPCLKELQQFWELDPTDPETAYKLAELTTNIPTLEVQTWTYLEVALKSSLSEFFCKKPFVMTSLWKKLSLDYVRLGPKGDLLKKIDHTVHPDCLPSLNLEATNRLYSPMQVEDREVAYSILNSQGKANLKMTDLFFTIYLLERPSQGQLFNYSWNRLLALGKSAQRRSMVMEQIKKLTPLPDALFSSLDINKKSAVLTLFKQNFPEYLDHYSDQCLNFYGGSDAFPLGNPTRHCQELMNTEKAAQVLGTEKLNKFNQIRNI